MVMHTHSTPGGPEHGNDSANEQIYTVSCLPAGSTMSFLHSATVKRSYVLWVGPT
jgi:hypothetical protein